MGRRTKPRYVDERPTPIPSDVDEVLRGFAADSLESDPPDDFETVSANLRREIELRERHLAEVGEADYGDDAEMVALIDLQSEASLARLAGESDRFDRLSRAFVGGFRRRGHLL